MDVSKFLASFLFSGHLGDEIGVVSEERHTYWSTNVLCVGKWHEMPYTTCVNVDYNLSYVRHMLRNQGSSDGN